MLVRLLVAEHVGGRNSGGTRHVPAPDAEAGAPSAIDASRRRLVCGSVGVGPG